MKSRELSNGLTRREALVAGAAAMGGLLAGSRTGFAADSKGYGPFKMGLQSYSLRHFKRDEALAKTKELGIHYWESYPGHTPIELSKVADTESAQMLVGTLWKSYLGLFRTALGK